MIGIYASISNESRSAFYMTKNDFEVASLGICVGLLFKVQIFWEGHKNLKNLSQILEISGGLLTICELFFSLFLGSSGASTISSQNSMSGSYCLCVAVKRQVIIYEITRLKSRHKRLREVLLPAQAQSLDVFSEGRLCVGYQSGNFELD